MLSSMFALGLSLTLREIAAPLRNVRVVGAALLVNFAVLPVAAVLLSRIPADPELANGILVLGAAAGAAFAPKLVEVARGDVASAAGLLVLLIVGTTVYLPLALPLFVKGADVRAGELAVQLGGQLLAPLVVGLLARARYPEESLVILPVTSQIANVALALLLIVTVTANAAAVLRLFGTGALLAIVAVIGLAMASGWWLGGPAREGRVTLSLGSGARNFAAAFVVANGSLVEQPGVAVLIAGASVIGLVMCFVLAGELRRHQPIDEGPPLPA